jgi:phosphopantothenoylcysteine decarboxylase / phosphopantothenate---cysteine ligase
MNFADKTILLVISGGIAAYKSLDLIRRLREQGAKLRVILTKGGAQFVTPLAISALSGEAVYEDLWSLTAEREMGHIRLSRDADLAILAPASANLIARLAHGMADDLAATTLLAAPATLPILLAPAMNPTMWNHPALQNNLAILRTRGFEQVGPAAGDMACGETGLGRLAEVPDILAAAAVMLRARGALKGQHALVTSGPTFEPIDPVRFLGNRSSGKQGHAIAAALARAGARVTLVTGPVALPPPFGVKTVAVETADEMLSACLAALPASIFVGCAAVGDWRLAEARSPKKLKKADLGANPVLKLTANPDIVATLAKHAQRPKLVIGFAAETENLTEQARRKLLEKNCDWLLANDVAASRVFAADENEVVFMECAANGAIHETPWPRQSKTALAQHLVAKIAAHDFKD